MRVTTPGNEFCSCTAAGTPRSNANATAGPLAYPPVPTTRFGLKVPKMRLRPVNDCVMAGISRQFCHGLARRMGSSGSSECGTPFSGSTRVSTPRRAPTKCTCAAGSSR
jgi:hypothetical protein